MLGIFKTSFVLRYMVIILGKTCGVYVFDILKLIIRNIWINTIFCLKNENQILKSIEFVDI